MVKDFSHIYIFPFILAALCIFVVSQYTLVRHKARGAWYLFFACIAASFWSLSEGLLYLDLTHESKILLTKCQYFGIAPIPPLTLLFVLTVFGIRSKMIGFLRWVLIAIIPLIIILVWTNPLHQLVFTGYYTIDAGAIEMLGLHHGLLWWSIIAYHYSLVVMISVILLKISYTATGFGRSQALLILAAVASVWIANGIYISGHSPVQNMDISPIAFSLVAGSMAWGFFRYNLLDILPVAKTEVFKGMDDAILVFDERNRIVNFNTAAEAIIKTEVSEDIVKQTQQVFKKFPVLQRIIENMKHSEVPIRVDGQKNIYDVRVSKLLGQNGNTIGRIMALRDITARKRAIEAILESEEKFKFLAENMADIVWTLDMDFNATYVSPSIEKVLGFTPEERKRQKFEEVVTPESLEQIMAMFLEELQYYEMPDADLYRSITIDVEYYHKNGSIVWMENSVRAIRNQTGLIIGMYGSSRDITDRKKAEKALLESEEKYRSLVETTSDWIWEVDKSGIYTYSSPKIKDLLGYEPEEILGKTPFDFMPQDKAKRVGGLFRGIVDSRGSFEGLENIILHKDGRHVVLETSGVPIFNADGNLIGYRGMDRDITERKQTEKRTQKLNRLNEDLLISANLTAKLKSITEGVVEIFDADFARIWITKAGDLCDSGCIHAHVVEGPHVCKKRDMCLHLLSSSGRYTHINKGHRRVPYGCYKIGRIASGDDSKFVTNDVVNDKRVHDNAWARKLGLKSFAGYRLLSEIGRPIGVLALFSKQTISSDTNTLLEGLANTTSQVIQTSLKEVALIQERDKLQEAVAQIKALSGMLPICSSCKEIRDDKGYWNQIESYIRDHTEAEFSHGICPECVKKLYPDINIYGDYPL